MCAHTHSPHSPLCARCCFKCFSYINALKHVYLNNLPQIITTKISSTTRTLVFCSDNYRVQVGYRDPDYD